MTNENQDIFRYEQQTKEAKNGHFKIALSDVEMVADSNTLEYITSFLAI